jgi:peptidoglycan/xylan/chitin deacetylase (PgdA/CDA1 family)
MRFLALFTLVFTVAPIGARLPRAFVPPPILMYHRVDNMRPADAIGRELTVTPAQLRAQLSYLKSHGLAGITMTELARRLQDGEPLDHVVVLTFDDGYSDQYTCALPLLRAFGAQATFYIITTEIGRPYHLSWPQLRAMEAMHMEVAAHGLYHDDLSTMTPAQQAFEIDDSVRALRAGLHAPVESYAYPSGRFNRETLQLVQSAGIELGVTTDPQYVLLPADRFEMTRVRVRGQWTLADFGAALQAAMRVRGVVIR